MAAPVPLLILAVPVLSAARDNAEHSVPDSRPQLLPLYLYLNLLYLYLQLQETIWDVLYLTAVLNYWTCTYICICCTCTCSFQRRCETCCTWKPSSTALSVHVFILLYIYLQLPETMRDVLYLTAVLNCCTCTCICCTCTCSSQRQCEIGCTWRPS